MLKYAKILNKETGLCEVGTGANTEFYNSIGMIKLDVKQSDINNLWYLASLCPMKTEEEKAAEEKERLALLSLTAADVERAIYNAFGKDFDDIVAMVESLNEAGTTDIDIKALKIELKANNFYRGNFYISKIGALLGITETQLDEFFETGDYTKLLNLN